MYSVKDLVGNKVKPTNERFGLWLLTENLDNNNLVTDIGNINYTNDEQQLEGFVPLTDMFCDNIMLVKITDFDNCEGSLNSNSFRLNKDICGSFNTYLRGVFKNFTLSKHGVKVKLPFSLERITKRSEGVIQVVEKDLELLRRKYKNPVAVPYKIELADVRFDQVLQVLPDVLERLAVEHYYLRDLDITQDFVGIFNKSEMCRYLTNNFNFVYSGEYKKSSNIIVDNDEKVGIDCLTWLNSNSRVKIYNKFICQITSPGVTKQLGNHVLDFLNCPDKRLKETFGSEHAQKNGITRLEATIYNYSTSNGEKIFDPLEDCKIIMQHSIDYFKNAPLYAVPIHKMWTKLTDTLQNSCCLVFKDLLQFVYWGNSHTKKLTGMQIKLPINLQEREKLIQYALSAFSFNCLPVNYIEVVDAEEMDNKISITHKCYIKNADTLFTRSSTPYSTLSADVNIGQLGLIATSNVIPQVLRKRTNITNKLHPFLIKEIPPLSIPYVISARKRKLEMDEMETKRRKIEFIENTMAVKEGYKVELAKEQEIKNKEDELRAYFRQRWADLDCNGVYKLLGFVVNKKDNFTYVGVLAETGETKAVYYLKGFNKNRFIELDKNRDMLKSAGFLILSCPTFRGDVLDIIYLPTKEPFCTFITNGTSSYNGHTFPNIERMQFHPKVFETNEQMHTAQMEVEQVHSTIMQNIVGTVKIKHCNRLEDIKEGTELLITAIRT